MVITLNQTLSANTYQSKANSRWGKSTAPTDPSRSLTLDRYTHHYGVRDTHSTEWVTAWPQLVQDAKRVVDATDVPLSGPTDDPRDDHVTPPLVDEIEGIDINGVAKMSHEPLIIHPKTIRSFEFVKTEGKPYDAAVGCILLRARVLAPKQFRLR